MRDVQESAKSTLTDKVKNVKLFAQQEESSDCKEKDNEALKAEADNNAIEQTAITYSASVTVPL